MDATDGPDSFDELLWSLSIDCSRKNTQFCMYPILNDFIHELVCKILQDILVKNKLHLYWALLDVASFIKCTAVPWRLNVKVISPKI